MFEAIFTAFVTLILLLHNQSPMQKTQVSEFKKTTRIEIKPTNTSIIPKVNINADYKDYYKNFDILHVYGVNKQRILNIIYTINPKYFEKLNDMSFVYSNKNVIKSAGTYNHDGFYAPLTIQIYVYNETDAQINYIILHELKHHWCYMNKNGEINNGLGFYNVNGKSYYTHGGCFLDTPLDKEYGFIK